MLVLRIWSCLHHWRLVVVTVVIFSRNSRQWHVGTVYIDVELSVEFAGDVTYDTTVDCRVRHVRVTDCQLNAVS